MIFVFSHDKFVFKFLPLLSVAFRIFCHLLEDRSDNDASSSSSSSESGSDQSDIEEENEDNEDDELGDEELEEIVR